MSEAVDLADADTNLADTNLAGTGPKPLTKEQLAARKRRRTVLLACLAALLVACVVFWQWDRLLDGVSTRIGGTPARGSQPITSYSGAQGAQDAPRAEVTENRRADREKCLETLRLRRVAPDVARDSCNKMVSGIYH